jgi:hypothetical protein
MPTTVLAQNDAGVGAKNGINAFGAKNFFGTFAAPFAVIISGRPRPRRQHRAGSAPPLRSSGSKPRVDAHPHVLDRTYHSLVVSMSLPNSATSPRSRTSGARRFASSGKSARPSIAAARAGESSKWRQLNQRFAPNVRVRIPRQRNGSSAPLLYHAAARPHASDRSNDALLRYGPLCGLRRESSAKHHYRPRDEAYAAMISDGAVADHLVRSESAARWGKSAALKIWGTVDDRRTERIADRKRANRFPPGQRARRHSR